MNALTTNFEEINKNKRPCCALALFFLKQLIVCKSANIIHRKRAISLKFIPFSFSLQVITGEYMSYMNEMQWKYTGGV